MPSRPSGGPLESVVVRPPSSSITRGKSDQKRLCIYLIFPELTYRSAALLILPQLPGNRPASNPKGTPLTTLITFTDTGEHDEFGVTSGAGMRHISIREVTGRDILAGKSDGLRDFPKLLDAVEQTSPGETVVLDWDGIEIATASYFGTTLIALLRMAMASELDCYFVVTNLNRTCIDELKLVLELLGLVVLTGEWTNGGIRKTQVLGSLDASYAETLGAIQKSVSASATELHTANRGRSGIGKTGWINRLSNLHRLRLIRKERVGREYKFHALS